MKARQKLLTLLLDYKSKLLSCSNQDERDKAEIFMRIKIHDIMRNYFGGERNYYNRKLTGRCVSLMITDEIYNWLESLPAINFYNNEKLAVEAEESDNVAEISKRSKLDLDLFTD